MSLDAFSNQTFCLIPTIQVRINVYQEQYEDEDIVLYYNRFRYYSPEMKGYFTRSNKVKWRY